jgi:23S rRNA (uracil1939-C5)-methyltransferase
MSAETARIQIERLDRQGRGRATHAGRSIAVPGAVAGDTLDVRLQPPAGRDSPWIGEVVSVIEASADRTPPPCRHFGPCGGCTLQHIGDRAYEAWKIDRIWRELARHGVALEAGTIGPLARTPPHARRRIDLTFARTGASCRLGLNQRGSHDIVDMQECTILAPVLFDLVAPLRSLLAASMPRDAEGEVIMNLLEGGADVLIVPKARAAASPRAREAALAFARANPVVRVAWGSRRDPETLVQHRAARLPALGVPVDIPPGAFLQASVEAERAMQALVRRWGAGARRIVDLFGGVGTLSLPLLDVSRVTLVDSDAGAVSAVDAGLRRGALLGRGEAMRQDLMSDPLQPAELERFDLAILDPPRAGAEAQVRQIAASDLRRVVMVSCNPDTFARDARLLGEAGFSVNELVPIDQFLWSTHVELAALLTRRKPTSRRR